MKIFIVIGKSSTGKDTIYSLVKERNENLKQVVMWSTRPQRDGEKNGVTYIFTNDKTTDYMVESGLVIEMREYNTANGLWRYFTADDGQIDRKSNDNYFIIGTLAVYDSYVQKFGAENVIPIYIEVKDGTRLHRALDREDLQDKPKYNELCRRFLSDSVDFSDENVNRVMKEHEFNRVENIDIEKSVKAVEGIIERYIT